MQEAGRIRLTALALLGAALLAFAAPARAAEQPPTGLPARAWVLIDAGDGKVLAAHRARSSYSIASTTKLMTAYVARERLKLGETVVAPPYDALAAESLLGLEPGEEIEVGDLLYGLLLVSGNDAAEALAQAAAGSEDAFVAKMNDAADRLGLDDTSYANPIGLDEAGNYSSAEDLAELAVVLRRDALFRRIFDTASTTIESGAHPRNLVNRNTLVQTVPYVNGVKTGYTIDAGNVLVGSGKQGGVELVSAVLGAPTESDRDAATLALLDYGFSLYHRRTPVHEGETEAEVALRDRDGAVELAPSEEITITVRSGERVQTRVSAPDEVAGPVSEGDRLGEAGVPVEGEADGRTALAATSSAAAASLLERYDAAVPGPRLVAWGIAIAALALLFVVAIALWDRR
ncbi:MAG: D-alanyl-D-alanine carboxypeptidase family protein [Vicinamibacteria bacterium]